MYQPASLASIYVNDASTAQSIPTGTTYTKLTCWTTNGVSRNCTTDAANDKITITVPGCYRVAFGLSYYGSANNVTLKSAVFAGGVEQDNIHSSRKNVSGADIVATANNGFVEVTSVPIDIDLRFRHDNGSPVDLTVVYGNLNVTRIC